jgi:hypothetical protein
MMATGSRDAPILMLIFYTFISSSVLYARSSGLLDGDMDEQQERLLKLEAHTDEPQRSLLSHQQKHNNRIQRIHLYALYFLNASLLLGLVVLSISKQTCLDPSLKTYCK